MFFRPTLYGQVRAPGFQTVVRRLRTSNCVLIILAASDSSTDSKQPRRLKQTSYLKSVTSITYFSMCILLIWNGPFLQPPRPLQPQRSNLTSDLKSGTLITYAAKSLWPLNTSGRWLKQTPNMIHWLPCSYCTEAKTRMVMALRACVLLEVECHFTVKINAVII